MQSEEAITKSYGIQTLAKNRMQYISLKYQTITYDQKMCTDGCSDAYVRETSALYAQLDACLAGEVITISPNEPEPITTDAPDTTTDIPTPTTDIPTPPQSDI